MRQRPRVVDDPAVGHGQRFPQRRAVFPEQFLQLVLVKVPPESVIASVLDTVETAGQLHRALDAKQAIVVALDGAAETARHRVVKKWRADSHLQSPGGILSCHKVQAVKTSTCMMVQDRTLA